MERQVPITNKNHACNGEDVNSIFFIAKKRKLNLEVIFLAQVPCCTTTMMVR